MPTSAFASYLCQPEKCEREKGGEPALLTQGCERKQVIALTIAGGVTLGPESKKNLRKWQPRIGFLGAVLQKVGRIYEGPGGSLKNKRCFLSFQLLKHLLVS